MRLRSPLQESQCSPPQESRRETAAARLPLSLVLLAALALSFVALPGCGGCWGGGANSAAAKKKKEEEEKKKKESKKKKLEKPKDDFEPIAIRMLPSSDPTQNAKNPPIYAKPGHWIALSETLKANNFDFPGELATFAETPADNRPLVVDETTQRLSIWSPAILPKGQAKRIESLIYLPRRKGPGLNRTYSLRSELHGVRGGRTEVFANSRNDALKDYQFLIVILASNPAAYAQFAKLNSVYMPTVATYETTDTGQDTLRHYYVLAPNSDRTVPLPSHPLALTTTSHIFWDDINPAVLTALQQEALLDWIHWGGQLVISGPGSLDKLRGSFLAPYLPADSAQTVKLEQAAFDELNSNFSLQRDPARAGHSPPPPKGDSLRRINVLAERPMLGVELKLHPAAQPIPRTGGLVVERRIGGGRIAVTSFPLTDVRIKNWKNFDGFVNNVLLRRPPRKFSHNMGGSIQALNVTWSEPRLATMLYEPRLGSTLRYFTRDIGYANADGTTPVNASGVTGAEEVATAPAAPPYDPRAAARARLGGYGYEEMPQRIETWHNHPDLDDWHFAGYHSTNDSGIAAWNDKSAASEAARAALTEAAGIEIPKAEFVMKVLGVYLLVLVPLNWLLFWLIGRVEWAWVAAPIIAIVGAGAVIRLAQLDIGFARNRTEIAVLEMQGGYERAHLTRYTALYTSLTSNYTAAFAEPTALALPFPGGPRNESFISIANYTDVIFRRDKETSLSGLLVYSNETGMLHSEQMLTLGKNPKVNESLLLAGDEQKGYSVRNTTDITIRDVGIIRRVDPPGGNQPPRIETAYVAKLEPATSAPLRFSPLKEDVVWLPEWNQSSSAFAPASSEVERGRVRLTQLARLAAQRLRLLPGDVRLVGWTSDLLPGMELRPAAPQNSTNTLVLSHLVRGPLPPVCADVNVFEDYLDPTFDLEPETEGDTTETPERVQGSGFRVQIEL